MIGHQDWSLALIPVEKGDPAEVGTSVSLVEVVEMDKAKAYHASSVSAPPVPLLQTSYPVVDTEVILHPLDPGVWSSLDLTIHHFRTSPAPSLSTLNMAKVSAHPLFRSVSFHMWLPYTRAESLNWLETPASTSGLSPYRV